MREKYNKDNFLNKTTMTVAGTTVCSNAYYVDGEKRVLLYASVYDTAAKTKTGTSAATKTITLQKPLLINQSNKKNQYL